VEVTVRYDNKCSAIRQTCDISIDIPKDMKAPVFIYYSVSNFYQNHRRYYQSRNAQQLAGIKVDAKNLKRDCSPVLKLADVRDAMNEKVVEKI
jgi:hypothetical protein